MPRLLQVLLVVNARYQVAIQAQRVKTYWKFIFRSNIHGTSRELSSVSVQRNGEWRWWHSVFSSTVIIKPCYYLRLSIPQVGSSIKILITNGGWFWLLSSQNLLELALRFELGTQNKSPTLCFPAFFQVERHWKDPSGVSACCDKICKWEHFQDSWN